MAGFKRRRVFRKGGKKRSFSKKKKFTRVRAANGISAANAKPSGNTSVSTLTFKLSRFNRMPLPDRYLTWVTIENQGSYPIASASTNTFGLALNDIINPFGKPGIVPATLPNIIIAGTSPMFVRNILVNATTNTGLYNNFRVWSTAVAVTYTTGNAADSVNTAMVPLTQANSAFTTFEAASQAANSITGTSTFGSSGAGSSILGHWSMPALQGVPKLLYPAFASAIGSGTATPGLPMYLQVSYRTDNNAALSQVLGVRVQLQYHVEFFNRADGVALT